MDITYFNYNEIIKKADNDPAAIVILTYAQTPLYNEFTTKILMKRLKINHVPQVLFRRKALVTIGNRIIRNYYTEEPASYIRNPGFLTYGIGAKEKALYIRALSMRRISDKENKIPRNYFNKVAQNPFLKVDDDFIYFPYEASN